MNELFNPNELITEEKNIRLAGPDDYAEIWRMGLAVIKENGLFNPDYAKIDIFVKRFIGIVPIPEYDLGPTGVIAVIGEPGSLEAMTIVGIGEFWYTRDKMLEEFIVYVDPEYRKTTHARRLIKWLKQQSEETGLPLMTGVISNERTEAKCRLYRRILPKVGEFFIYNKKAK